MIVPFLFSILAGIIYAFGFPHFLGAKGVFLAPTFAFALIYYQWGKVTSLKQKIILLSGMTLSFTLVAYYWIAQTLVEFGGLPYPIAVLLNLFFFLIVMPQYLVYLFLENYSKKQVWLKNLLDKLPQKSRLILSAILFTSLEYFIPQQFPGHLGHNWMTIAPFLGLAPIGGVPLFSFFSYLLAFTLVNYFSHKEKSWSIIGAFLLFLGANLLFPLKPFKDEHHKINVRIVQPNVGNFLKLESEKGDERSVQSVINALYTQAVEKSFNPELIVFPETSYPYSFYAPATKIDPSLIPSVFKRIQAEVPASILVGGYDLKTQKENLTNYYEQEYNSAFFINADNTLQDVYHKHLLIPFGETLPVGPLKGILSKVINNITYFAEGRTWTTFTFKPGIHFVTPICYEVLFPSFIRSQILADNRQVNFIINLTNDSWYGRTAEIEQHLFLAKWRALEFGIPMIRSTNTGITSVIYPDGSESPRLPIYQEAALDHELKVPVSKHTLYLRYGFEVVLLIGLIFFLISYLLEKPSLSFSKNRS